MTRPKKTSEKVFTHAILSESKPRLEAGKKLAESEESLVVPPERLDADPWLFNVENGTVDLRIGELREHSRSDLITQLAPVAYDPEATRPIFERFLAQVLPDLQVRSYVQKVFGYSLTGDTSDQAFYLLEGEGSNGKTTLLEAVAGVFGDYAKHVDSSTFMTQRRRGVREDIARLRGARLVLASEVEDDARFAEVLVKSVTGGEALVASFLFQNSFEFRPQFKAFLGVNKLPAIRGDQRPQESLPVLGLMRERGQCHSRLQEPIKGGVPRRKRPAPEPPHGRTLGVLRPVFDHQQGDRERVVEVDGGELGSGRLDERQVAALERLAEPPVVAPLDRHEHMFAPRPGTVRVAGLRDAKLGTSDTVATALCCKNCGTRWFAPAPERLLEVGERCLVCDGELEQVVEPTPEEEGA